MDYFDVVFEYIFPSNTVETYLRNPAYVSRIPPARPAPYPWMFSIFDYRNTYIRRGIRILKTRASSSILKTFSMSMSDLLIEELSDQLLFYNFSTPLLIPIPVSAKRFRERGFNQAELLANQISIVMGTIPVVSDVLTKHKETSKQATVKNKMDRMNNVIGCFSVKNKEKIKNRNIILIDDVTTTGATLAEARTTLLQAGARQVVAVTVAH